MRKRSIFFGLANWALGIIPVPLAIGISDQHRQKIFNVYQQLTRKKINTGLFIYRSKNAT